MEKIMILEFISNLFRKFMNKKKAHDMKWKFSDAFYFDEYGTPVRIKDMKDSCGKRKSSGVTEMSQRQAGLE
jgi:2-hydroxy-3-keto-5-methylthiopentenyl-1-phosphate phosphatase